MRLANWGARVRGPAVTAFGANFVLIAASPPIETSLRFHLGN